MNCLKCGKKIRSGQVFCADCLQDMEASPVEPGTPIQFFLREERQPEKVPRRKRKGYADSMRTLQRAIRWLCAALAVTTLIICLLAGWLYHTLSNNEKADIGKNYTTVETS